jgi:hypothetical protein
VLAPLLLVAAGLIVQEPTPGIVWGQVRSEGTGVPLRHAVVELVDRRAGIVAETDANGFYILRNVPPGRRLVRVTHIDHAAHQIELVIASGAQVYVDFDLELRPVPLPVVTARAPTLPNGMPDTVVARTADLGTATVHVLEATPGMAELGLAEAVREVPGHEPPDPSDALFVRGGFADLKLVLLNGAPVYAPFHIGGLIAALDADVLRSARLHVGGAPARYDGGLSYIMEMETRSGRNRVPHIDFGLDMLSGRVIAEGPAGDRVAVLASARTVHGLGATPFVNEPFPYTYGDGMARIDVDLGSAGAVSGTGFWNREFVRLDSVGGLTDAAQWGNDAGSVRYRGAALGGEVLVTVAYGSFRTQLPLGGAQPIVTEGISRRGRLAADLASFAGPVRLGYGASFDRLRYENRAWARGAPGDSASFRSLAAGDQAGVYMDAAVTVRDRVRVRAGLRADAFSLDPGVRLAPRLATTLLLGERASLTLAGGRYRQYVRAAEGNTLFGPVTTDDLSGPALNVAEATHLVLTLDQGLGDDLSLGIEGFYKTFTGLPSVSGGRAEASGVDVWIRRTGSWINGWFGYSLAWVWSTDADPWAPEPLFAGRHLVSAGVTGRTIGRGVVDLRVAYGAGLPYTAIPEPDLGAPVFGVAFRPAAAPAEPVSTSAVEPDTPYLRLDAQLARTFDVRWGDFDFAITPYVKVLNALDRRDAIFYHLQRDGASPQLRALAALPVLPIVGMTWKF